MNLTRGTITPPPALTPPMFRQPDMGLASKFFSAPSADPTHAIVEVRGCPLPPLINGDDLVCVDFTHTRLTCDSLYVIVFTDGPSPWIGIRHFRCADEGWFLSDASGSNPKLMKHADLICMQVIGRVKNVFKSSDELTSGWRST